MQGPEYQFQEDFAPNNMAMIEGLSTVRARLISERARWNHIDVPSMGTLRNERKIKDLAFDCRINKRDSMAECMMMLSLRRGCLYTAMQNSGKAGKPTLMRLHLLSSYSSLRDDQVSVVEWVKLVGTTFGNNLPSRLIMLDHRTRNGSMDLANLESPHRDRGRLERDCRRRYEALKALHEYFGIEVLNIPAGTNPQSEVGRALNFIHRSSK